MQKWVKVPGPGQFRGEGPWTKLEESGHIGHWNYLVQTGYLPTHVGDEPPAEAKAGE